MKHIRNRQSESCVSIPRSGEKLISRASRPNIQSASNPVGTVVCFAWSKAQLYEPAHACASSTEISKERCCISTPQYVHHGVRWSHNCGLQMASHKPVKLRCRQPTLRSDRGLTFISVKPVTQFHGNVQQPESGRTSSNATLSLINGVEIQQVYVGNMNMHWTAIPTVIASYYYYYYYHHHHHHHHSAEVCISLLSMYFQSFGLQIWYCFELLDITHFKCSEALPGGPLFNGSKYCSTLLETVGLRVQNRNVTEFSSYNVDFKRWNCPSARRASTANAIDSDSDTFKGRSVSVSTINWCLILLLLYFIISLKPQIL